MVDDHTIRDIDESYLSDINNLISAEHDFKWSLNQIQQSLQQHCCYGLFKKEQFVGFIFFQDNGENIDLLFIFIDMKYRGLSLGYRLLSKTLILFKTMDRQFCFLEVAENNVKAIDLYEKFGFCCIATRKNYYRSQSLSCDARIYRLKL